ncbi:DDE_3 domain-containing protein [Trichonephila clavipes]|nr:DDE_3 domain-containing protein [Trichonephila clavipes]
MTTLTVMCGTLSGQLYVDDILRPHVGPFLNGLRGTIFQQDNAGPHTASVAQDFLRHFQTLPWPACSTDLSPVEHVWEQLKRQMPSCHSVHDLELAVQDLWAHLPQDNIRCLINSMPHRVAIFNVPECIYLSEKTGHQPTQRDKPSNLDEKTEDMPTQRDKPSNLGVKTEDMPTQRDKLSNLGV